MAEAKQPGKAQMFLATHGEKVGLGTAALLLLVYVGVFWLWPGEDKTLADAKADLERIMNGINDEHPDQNPGELKHWEAEAKAPWSDLGPEAKAPHDLASVYQPKVEIIVTKVAPVRVVPAVIQSVTIKMPTAALDGVTLGWALSDWPTNKEEGKEFEKAEITHFVLERQQEDGEWEVLESSLEGTSSAYRDERIEPKTTYAYRLTPHTDSAKWKKYQRTTAGASSNTVKATTMGIFEFRIVAITSTSSRNQAFLKVIKFVAGVGPQEINKMYFVGDPIGADPEKLRNKEKDPFDHTIQIKGKTRAMKINFETGWTIKAIEERKIYLDKIICEDVRDPDTKLRIGCKQKTEKVPYTVSVLVWSDENGKDYEKIHQMPTVNHNFCKDHQTQSDSSTTQDDKKPDPEKDPAKIKEATAKTMLDDANALWKKGKKDEARSMYSQLMADFADTRTVKRSKKLIQKRIDE